MKPFDRVKELREKHRLTHVELAQLAGIPSPSQISRIETGRNLVSSIEMRVRLAQGFGLTLQELCDYLDERMTVDVAYSTGRPRLAVRISSLRESVRASRADELEEAIQACGGAIKLGPVVPVVRHLAAEGIEQTKTGWMHTIRYFSAKIDHVLAEVERDKKAVSVNE